MSYLETLQPDIHWITLQDLYTNARSTASWATSPAEHAALLDEILRHHPWAAGVDAIRASVLPAPELLRPAPTKTGGRQCTNVNPPSFP
jgi:hypothetical protein